MCKHCERVQGLRVVEDEVHVIFECPSYQRLRQDFGNLFTYGSPGDLRTLLITVTHVTFLSFPGR